MFDNGTYRGYSRILELNPETEEVVWSYEDPENFFSPYRAGVQRLPNSNTLICESDAGRIFEVTPEGEIVWDFLSPFIGQPARQGRHIYRATRYSEEYLQPVFQSRDEQVVAVGRPSGEQIDNFPELLDFYQQGLDE
jgi:hypothetical protein